MLGLLQKPPIGFLDPMERISEILFAVIMALTFTCTLAVETAGDIQVRNMLFAALGCNLAWGIIDAGIYLMTRVNDESSKITVLRAIRDAPDSGAVRRIIADEIHPLLASTISIQQLESTQVSLRRIEQLPGRTRLTAHDYFGAIGTCLLCFLSTLPIALPFLFVNDARLGIRISNAVATAMLFLCGYVYGVRSELQPWATAIAMVAFGGAMIGVAIALGG
jgi:hypothetical protein